MGVNILIWSPTLATSLRLPPW